MEGDSHQPGPHTAREKRKNQEREKRDSLSYRGLIPHDYTPSAGDRVQVCHPWEREIVARIPAQLEREKGGEGGRGNGRHNKGGRVL